MATKPPATSMGALYALGGFVAGGALVGVVMALSAGAPAESAGHALRESDLSGASQYQYVDPLIGVSSNQTDSPQYASLESSVERFIATQQKSGLSAASVNVRDIGAGQGFAVDPDELYSPASLYKVPVMIAYYKLAESDPAVLDARLTYAGGSNEDANENIASNVQLTPGQSYTVEQLIEHMIKYSDNNALSLLTAHLSAVDPSALSDTVSSLGVPYGDSSDFLKVGAYSIFFRTLYNATYLSADYSERALALLAETDFAQGIEAGVPNSVAVAHKFGDSDVLASGGQPMGYELHDCGIVYYPGHPYLLCVMTKGQSIGALESAIAGISKLVYQDMEHRYGAR